VRLHHHRLVGAEIRLRRLSGWAYLCALSLGLALVPAASAVRAAASCAWQVSPSVDAPKGVSVLYGVDAHASDDVWAVGVGGPYELAEQGVALSEHWDGRSWHQVPTAKIRKGALLGVTAVSASEAGAVGAQGDTALIERWNGTHWSIVVTPDVGKSVLLGVNAASPRDVWAVGTRKSWAGTIDGPAQPLIEHWDGTRWRVVASANPATKLSLDDVSVARDGEVWTVGEAYGGNRCVERR